MGDAKEELTAADVMQVVVKTVPSTMTLPELESELLQAKVSGFPVVDTDRILVGIVSRSDVIRTICSERDIATITSDFYYDEIGFHEAKMESFKDIADRVGERLEGFLVKDVMIKNPRTVSPNEPIREISRQFVEHRIHRLPVTDGCTLVGIVTTMDLVRLISQGRVVAKR